MSLRHHRAMEARVGAVVRAMRRRRGWRQVDLAAAAGVSQASVSLIERGHLDRFSLRIVREVLGALDAGLFLEVRRRGAEVDRLLDEGHAAVGARLASKLRGWGWEVRVEVSYSEFGERGSIDLLAWHAATGSLLVIEIKTEIPSAEATLRKLDEKGRLATKVAAERFGWVARSVSRVLVVPANETDRRRVARQAALFDAALPARSNEIRRWLRDPVAIASRPARRPEPQAQARWGTRPGSRQGPMARPESRHGATPGLSGLWFLSPTTGRDGNQETGRVRRRVRVPVSTKAV
jgi:transcriptional regulator with XRE-family HTH domain